MSINYYYIHEFLKEKRDNNIAHLSSIYAGRLTNR